MNRKDKMVDELITELEKIEKQRDSLEELVWKLQGKLFGIEAVMVCMTQSITNENITIDTFRTGMEVVLDSVHAVVNTINEKI
jgi:hypothetical protein